MKRFALVYQCGIANVFDVTPVRCKLCQDRPGFNGVGKPCNGCTGQPAPRGFLACTDPKRLMQDGFRACENFIHGARAAGVEALVFHCDKAGDITNLDWEEGAGDMFADTKQFNDTRPWK